MGYAQPLVGINIYHQSEKENEKRRRIVPLTTPDTEKKKI
jgi:hypothetical protein